MHLIIQCQFLHQYQKQAKIMPFSKQAQNNIIIAYNHSFVVVIVISSSKKHCLLPLFFWIL